MNDIVDSLWGLHKQATTERSRYYTAGVVQEAIEEIERLRAEVERLRDALSVFANDKSWHMDEIGIEWMLVKRPQDIARRALGDET